MITKCRAVQLAIALCASLFGTHAWGEDFQIVTIASEVVAVPANNFEVEIVYNTSNSNANLPGLGLRVHFDAAKLTWVQNTFINELALVGISPPMTDVEDFDNDPDTDMYIHKTLDYSFDVYQSCNTINHDELQYLNLLQQILSENNNFLI